MKIAIYLDNKNISDVNCSDLTKGNPGIGGTEYCILLLAQLYKQYFKSNEVLMMITKQGVLPVVDGIFVVKDIYEGAETASNQKADIFLISAVDHGKPLPKAFFDKIQHLKQKTVTWGHNFYLSDFCSQVASCKYVKANVFVGCQQYDRYLDHKIIKKSTYIYNMYPEHCGQIRDKMKNHVVTYIGSLVPTKGFHVLAAAWKSILEKVPDAELNVIGSGKLYGRDSQLGKYEIAERDYEKLFMPGLLDEKGEILPSVHFLGVLGENKNSVILNTAVGVPNPTGRTETFGISALDFESLGVPVVTIAKGGFLDTVVHQKTGLLYDNTADLAENIIKMLTDSSVNEQYGRTGNEFVRKFMPEKILEQWNTLFCKVANGQQVEFIQPDSFMSNNLKSYRWLNRRIKNKIHIEYPISVIGMETIAKKMLRLMGK